MGLSRACLTLAGLILALPAFGAFSAVRASGPCGGLGPTVLGLQPRRLDFGPMTLRSPVRPADELRVTGDVDHPLRLTADQLARYPSFKAPLHEHDGSTVQYEGPRLADILKDAGVVAGPHPGKQVAVYVSVVASDGYQVVFGLGELTQSISGRNIILALRGDGKPLGPNVGPYRVVVEGDLVQARCARMVTELRVGRLRR